MSMYTQTGRAKVVDFNSFSKECLQRTLDHVTSSDKGYIHNTTPTIREHYEKGAEGLYD